MRISSSNPLSGAKLIEHDWSHNRCVSRIDTSLSYGYNLLDPGNISLIYLLTDKSNLSLKNSPNKLTLNSWFKRPIISAVIDATESE